MATGALLLGLGALNWAPSCGLPTAMAAPADDLSAGQTHLQAGEYDQALPRLVAAAQALPESVEAQLALAECYLRLGRLDDALTQYQAVVKLSPEHAQAKRMAAALSGRATTVEQRLETARTLLSQAVYGPAEQQLASLMQSPLSDAQRSQVALLLAEAQLWAGNADGALATSLKLVADAEDAAVAGQARVLAALAACGTAAGGEQRVGGLLEGAGELPEPWKERAALAAVLAKLEGELDAAAAVEISRGLGGVSRLPAGGFRSAVTAKVFSQLHAATQAAAGAGKVDEALEIVWSMIGQGATPKTLDEAFAADIGTGWLFAATQDEASRTAHLDGAAHLLLSVGRAETARRGAEATHVAQALAGRIWLNGMNSEGTRQRHGPRVIALLQELGAMSRPAADRKAGEPLSSADRLQSRLALDLIASPVGDDVRRQAVETIAGQLERYRQAGDLASGLLQFVAIGKEPEQDNAKVEVTLDPAIAAMPRQESRFQLLYVLSQFAAVLGEQEFQKRASTLDASANKRLNRFDQAVFVLGGVASNEFPAHNEAQTLAANVLERYASIARFEAAELATQLLHASSPDSKRQWALIGLTVRKAQHAQNQTLAAHRRLGDALDPSLQKALHDAHQLVVARNDKPTRDSAVALAQPLIDAFAALRRDDLAEQVIKALAGGAPPAAAEGGEAAAEANKTVSPLDDWAIWARSQLLARRAAEAVARASRQAGEGRPIPLAELHQQELALLGELVAAHPQSDYRSAAVERVLAIADAYQAIGSFDTALAVVREFHAAHPNIAPGQRLAYRQVQIALAKAAQAFQKRSGAPAPPTKISEEYAAALDAIAAFLQANPTGDFSPQAEADLFQVARVYGEANAWPLAREVLARFAAAVPDYRHASWLKYQEAVTWLGELDRDYALALLAPQPVAQQPSDPQAADAISQLASNLPQSGPGFPPPPAAESPQASASPVPGGDAGGFGFPAGGTPSFAGQVGMGGAIREPNETALAMIRQSQERQYHQLAMLDIAEGAQVQAAQQVAAPQAVLLASGRVLSEAEMKRQDDAADKAYALLLALANSQDLGEAVVAESARQQILWLFGFFEGQRRPDRAIALIERFLKDRPQDPARIALLFQAANDLFEQAALRQPSDQPDLVWLNRRHELFEQARAKIREFIEQHPDQHSWLVRARRLLIDSYDRESQLAASVSGVRAGGLLVQSAEALLELLAAATTQADQSGIPEHLWALADRLQALGQESQAIYVLEKLPLHFATHPLANQAVLRVAQLHAAHLTNPLKAVETFQEYLGLAGDDEQVRSQIFAIGQQLSERQRYLEALHVFGVFVDSFPSDPRAAEAIRAAGQVHQANESWQEAIAAYRRILDEFASHPIATEVKLSIAECQINLSDWRSARRLYEEYLQQHPQDGQAAMAQSRLAVLKNLERFQNLLADEEVTRNKDDAQFQIARIVLEQLQNHVKAAAEFRKVVEKFPRSDLADDAQLEIGRAFLSLGRHEDARRELAKVPEIHSGSPVADDALYLIGQSYERQAESLASVTVDKAKAEAWERNQRGAYRSFNRALMIQSQAALERRDELKKAGKSQELALDEAASAFRFNAANFDGLNNTLRQAEAQAETESALQVANRQDRINEAYRDAVEAYAKAAADYPLGDNTDDALLRIAQLQETQLDDREAAMKTYQNIVKLFPGTPVAEDAAWNVAQFYEQEGKYAAAVAAYRDFIRTYPASSRVADSQFALAEMHEQLGQWVDAMDAYETFRQKFSQHPKAALAAEQITWIKAYRK